MNLLIIGGTGFISGEIVNQALKAGRTVTLFNRGKSKTNSSCKLIKGDVEDLLSFKDEILNAQFDAVIHSVAYTEKHADDLVEIFKGTDVRLVVLGSQDCYNVFQQLVRGKEAEDFPTRETNPVSSIKYYWNDLGREHAGGEKYDKNLMTDILMKCFERNEISPVVLRLPMVYGPEDMQFQNRHGSIIRRILDKKKTYTIGSLEQGSIFTYDYVVNTACAVVHALESDIIGKIYNIGETSTRSYRRWAELYSEVCGWQFDFVVVPDEFLLGKPDLANHPSKHLITDCTAFQRDTGFTPPVSLSDAIRQTFEWAKENPSCLQEIDYKHEEALRVQYGKLQKEMHKNAASVN